MKNQFLKLASCPLRPSVILCHGWQGNDGSGHSPLTRLQAPVPFLWVEVSLEQTFPQVDWGGALDVVARIQQLSSVCLPLPALGIRHMP